MPLEIGQSSNADFWVLRCELSPTKFCSDARSFRLSKLSIRFIKERWASHECGGIVERGTLDLAGFLGTRYIYDLFEDQVRLFIRKDVPSTKSLLS